MKPSLFGARLRELREAAGLSRKELAEKAGMKSEGGIRNIEQGLNEPTWPTVLALAAALGVDCTAFTQEPSQEAAEPRKPGRPRRTQETTPPTTPPPVEAEPAAGEQAAGEPTRKPTRKTTKKTSRRKKSEN